MWNFLNKKVINGAGVLLAGMMAVSVVPMQVEASGALGRSFLHWGSRPSENWHRQRVLRQWKAQ